MDDHIDLSPARRRLGAEVDRWMDTLRRLHGSQFHESWRPMIEDVVKYSSIEPELIRQWVQATRVAAQSVRDASHLGGFAVSVLWIRLHVILNEVLPHLERMRARLGLPPTRFESSLAEVRSQISNEEGLFIEYHRHSEVHPCPGVLRLKKGKMKKGHDTNSATEPAIINRLYQGLDVDYIIALIDRLLKQASAESGVPPWDAHNVVARDLAVRVLPWLVDAENNAWRDS